MKATRRFMASGFSLSLIINPFLGVLALWVTGAQWKISGDKMISWKAASTSKKILHGRDAILRVRVK